MMEECSGLNVVWEVWIWSLGVYCCFYCVCCVDFFFVVLCDLVIGFGV